jgi:nitroimidazol reductase NimA-like FMN-containing flavoprotein (pyridoxamine 5'-phosphate oxidase superfamily)
MKNSLNDATRGLITRILGEHRLMTIATNRPDGWPQATTVGYVNEGLLLYCFIGRTSQKYMNITRDRRVSITIAGESADASGIKGLSLAGLADAVQDRQDYMKFWHLFQNRCPGFGSWPEPNPAMAPLLRITPVVISVVDYSKGFGHSELVTVSNADLRPHAAYATG